VLEMLTCKVGHGGIKERRLKESGWLGLEFGRVSPLVGRSYAATRIEAGLA